MKKQIESIRTKIINTLKEKLNTDAFLKAEFALSAEVVFNPRMRTSAGRAHFKQNLIELNKELLGRHPEHLEQTVVHEFAHLIAHAVFGHRLGGGHGYGWKRTMTILGFPADRCHDLEVSADKRRPHKIRAYVKCNCENGLHAIKTKLYNKIQVGGKYRCKRCGVRLELA